MFIGVRFVRAVAKMAGNSDMIDNVAGKSDMTGRE